MNHARLKYEMEFEMKPDNTPQLHGRAFWIISDPISTDLSYILLNMYCGAISNLYYGVLLKVHLGYHMAMSVCFTQYQQSNSHLVSCELRHQFEIGWSKLRWSRLIIGPIYSDWHYVSYLPLFTILTEELWPSVRDLWCVLSKVLAKWGTV